MLSMFFSQCNVFVSQCSHCFVLNGLLSMFCSQCFVLNVFVSQCSQCFALNVVCSQCNVLCLNVLNVLLTWSFMCRCVIYFAMSLSSSLFTILAVDQFLCLHCCHVLCIWLYNHWYVVHVCESIRLTWACGTYRIHKLLGSKEWYPVCWHADW